MVETVSTLVPAYFVFGAVVISAIAVWWIQTSRLARQGREFSAVSRDNAKIAQELHDALLQGVLGIAWQIEAASMQLPAHPEEAKEQINQLLTRMDSILGEARQSIWDLQAKSQEPVNLIEVLRQKAKLNFESPRLQFPVETIGPPCGVIPEVAHSLVFIIREAWMNARQHAGATEIRTLVHYGPGIFEITISDNGKGMNLGSAIQGPGKWGIAGMHQRALKVKANLTICSTPGLGTSIGITMDSALAYSRLPTASALRSLWRRSHRTVRNRQQ